MLDLHTGEKENHAQTPRDFYLENGYYIWRNLIPSKKIEDILAAFQTEFLPSKKLYQRQNTSKWEPHHFNSYGYITNSVGDPHDLQTNSRFEGYIRNIICSQETQKALSILTGESPLRLVQSMFFDANAETAVHTDNVYLDSVPHGHLIAGWFALEDIHEDSGRFYVYPKSNHIKFDLTGFSATGRISIDNSLVTTVAEYAESHLQDLYAPALRKGDVLFWNSATVHGSCKTKDPRYSRRSLTAHYVPKKFQFGNLFSVHDESKFSYAQHEGMDLRVGIRQCPYPQAETIEELQSLVCKYVDENQKILVEHEKIFATLQAEINGLREGGWFKRLRRKLAKLYR